MKEPNGVRGDPAFPRQESGEIPSDHGNRHKSNPKEVEPVYIKAGFHGGQQPGYKISDNAHRLNDHGAPNDFRSLSRIPPAKRTEQPNKNQGRGCDVKNSTCLIFSLFPVILDRFDAL